MTPELFHQKRIELFNENGIESSFLSIEAYCYLKVNCVEDEKIVASLKKRGF